MKKLISFILTLALALTLPCASAFAAEPDYGTANAKVSVDIPIPANSSRNVFSPMMWDDQTYTLESGHVLYPLNFYVPDRYFAYEVRVYGSGTGVVTVDLMEDYALISQLSATNFNGQMYKNDWIDLYGEGTTLFFKITNSSTSTVTIHLTYYSWK